MKPTDPILTQNAIRFALELSKVTKEEFEKNRVKVYKPLVK